MVPAHQNRVCVLIISLDLFCKPQPFGCSSRGPGLIWLNTHLSIARKLMPQLPYLLGYTLLIITTRADKYFFLVGCWFRLADYKASQPSLAGVLADLGNFSLERSSTKEINKSFSLFIPKLLNNQLYCLIGFPCLLEYQTMYRDYEMLYMYLEKNIKVWFKK